MEVIYNTSGSNVVKRPTGVGLGNFDGLHIGHMTLINTLISESKFIGLDSVVYTFSKHPENMLRKELFTPLLTTVSKKIQLLGETSLSYMYFDEFNETFSRMKPESFVKNVLVDKLNIRLAVAGFDYRFGYKGQGDVKLLEKLGKKYNYTVIVIPPVKIDNEVVSSTLIRSNVAKGNMDRVFKLLGRHYSITGKVQNGRRIGSTLGFPTANIHPERYLTLPQKGVYITKTLIDGELYEGVTNVGSNPTVSEQNFVSIETHIFDFDKDIYGEDIEVFFISKVRSEKKFKSKDELVKQVNKDIQAAKDFFYMNSQ
jgi:riboflavin kinase/FMN adenylyltransferase